MKINFILRKRTELEYQIGQKDQTIAGRADDFTFKLRFVKYAAVVTTQRRELYKYLLRLKHGAVSLYVSGSKFYLMLFYT
jgi:hypothetical protein